jgi:hypothetical protein
LAGWGNPAAISTHEQQEQGNNGDLISIWDTGWGLWGYLNHGDDPTGGVVIRGKPDLKRGLWGFASTMNNMKLQLPHDMPV